MASRTFPPITRAAGVAPEAGVVDATGLTSPACMAVLSVTNVVTMIVMAAMIIGTEIIGREVPRA